jgi:transcriptional regulator with XRE-family HTH domain
MVLRLLRSQRRKAGLTLAEVGAATGLSAPTLHRVETGQYAPDSDTLGAIAESVGLSKDETSSLQTAVHGGFVSVEDMASDVSTAFVQCLPDVRVRVFAHIEVLVRGRTGHDDLMESVRGLMMNGDRKALVEIWPLMRRAGAFSQVSNDERMVLQTLWTVARTGLSRRCPEPSELWNLGKRVEAMPPSVSKGSSMLYMARLAAIHKDWEDVLSWSECVELESGENPDLRLLAAINGHLVTAKWGSPSQALDGFGSVIARALNPVIKYTAEVYFAHVAISCGQVDRAREALERARHYEVRHKFGSPMADTQRAHLARA